jgi:hypothetical protein
MAKKISANLSSDQSIVVSRFQIDPANFTLSSLPDTSITSPVNGNFLSYYNNNWVNVDATTARTNLGLGSLATLNSLAFADLTDKPTTITGYGITDAVTSVDGNIGAVTTLQLGTSSTTALRGDTAIPDVSDFITASSTESLTNKTNLSIINNTKGTSAITTGADADFLFTTIHDENHEDYIAPGNFSVLGVKSNASISTKNLSLTSNSGTMAIMSLSNSVPMSITGIGGINLGAAIGSVQILKQINHAADFSQANTNLFLYNTNTSAINSGSSIVFGAKYDSTTYATFLSEGPYIASYKVNATDNDYSFGLKFATIKNGATSQAVAMTIDEDQNVGINGGLTIDSLGTLAVPIPTVVTFDNQFGATTLDVKSSADGLSGNEKAIIKVSARSKAAVEFRSRNFGNDDYDLFFGHVASSIGESQDYAMLRAPTSRFVIKSDDDMVELRGTTVLLNTPTVEVGGTILFKVIPQTVSGVLTVGSSTSINQFRDSGSFTMPLANSITANYTLVAELPEKFAYNTPTITTSGSDVFRISTGTDTVISFNGPATLTFTSDGVSEWSL